MKRTPLAFQFKFRWCLGIMLGAFSVSLLEAQVSPGHRLYGRMGDTDTHLVDNQGNILHTWASSFSPGVAIHMLGNGNLLRSIHTGMPGAGAGGGVQEVALDGTVIWDFRYDTGGVLAHHVIEALPNGNVLMVAWEEKTIQEAIDAGRDPATIQGTVFAEHIIEVVPTGPNSGSIVWAWHIWDHLVQDFDMTRDNWGDPSQHPELLDINHPSSRIGELNHFNGMDYDPVNDLIIVSATQQNEIWIIDHSCSDAEADTHNGGFHGKGGDLIYRWGNPLVYRQGTPADQQLFFQHSPKFIPLDHPGGGNITVLSNQASPTSTAYELVLPKDSQGFFYLESDGTYGPAGPVWSYSDPSFDSDLMSSVQRLPNGHTLICSTLQSRIFEIDPSGQNQWEYSMSGPGLAAFNSDYQTRTLWTSSESISAAAGGTVEFTILEGTDRANDIYIMLGSMTGTQPGFDLGGFHVPLNWDAYSLFTARNAGGPVLPGSFGTLDSFGRSSASLVIPPGAATILVGTTLSHSIVMFDPVNGQVIDASHAVALTIDP